MRYMMIYIRINFDIIGKLRNVTDNYIYIY